MRGHFLNYHTSFALEGDSVGHGRCSLGSTRSREAHANPILAIRTRLGRGRSPIARGRLRRKPRPRPRPEPTGPHAEVRHRGSRGPRDVRSTPGQRRCYFHLAQIQRPPPPLPACRTRRPRTSSARPYEPDVRETCGCERSTARRARRVEERRLRPMPNVWPTVTPFLASAGHCQTVAVQSFGLLLSGYLFRFIRNYTSTICTKTPIKWNPITTSHRN